MKKTSRLFVLAALLSSPLHAASQVGVKFESRLIVEAGCEIYGQDIDFGVWGILQDTIRIKVPMKVTCTFGTPYSVTIDGGQSGEPYKRYMQGGSGELVMYNLYLDGDFRQIWGLDVGANDLTDVGTGVGQELVIFAEVPVQTSPSPGVYTDKITATINY